MYGFASHTPNSSDNQDMIWVSPPGGGIETVPVPAKAYGAISLVFLVAFSRRMHGVYA